jgi:hypothetical protein
VEDFCEFVLDLIRWVEAVGPFVLRKAVNVISRIASVFALARLLRLMAVCLWDLMWRGPKGMYQR